MSKDTDNPYEALEKLFHEPNRLAILSALCAANRGLVFTEIKTACGLTDGNLSRHLRALEEAGVVRIRKTFKDLKPCTTVTLTDTGLARFQAYLAALSQVLEQAKGALGAERRESPANASARGPRAAEA